MKSLIFVVIALGTAVIYIPSALADSFGYRTNGSNDVAKFAVDTIHANSGNGVAGARAFATGGTLVAREGSQFRSSNGGRQASNFDNISLSGTGGFASDNLLNQSTSTRGHLDRSGVLVDFSGNEVNLLLGAFSHADGNNAGSGRHFNLGDKGGFRINDGVSKVTNELAAGASTLAATPEPGSLFLLGTGLLCLALVLFRRGAKRPADS